jgi:hypothetical protein
VARVAGDAALLLLPLSGTHELLIGFAASGKQ